MRRRGKAVFGSRFTGRRVYDTIPMSTTAQKIIAVATGRRVVKWEMCMEALA